MSPLFVIATASGRVPPPDPGAVERLVHWAASSGAAATSLLINVVSLLLAIGGFYLYFDQKREYRLLFAMFEEYGLKQRITEQAKGAEEAKARAEQELNAARNAINAAQADLRERIPVEARKAYYENTIPALQKQIFDLVEQLNRMQASYSELGGQSVTIAPQIERVLTQEVRRHVSIRRDMERSEAFLAIYTGTTASIGTILRYPLDLLAVPFAILALREAVRFFWLSRLYYRSTRKKRVSKSVAA